MWMTPGPDEPLIDYFPTAAAVAGGDCTSTQPATISTVTGDVPGTGQLADGDAVAIDLTGGSAVGGGSAALDADATLVAQTVVGQSVGGGTTSLDVQGHSPVQATLTVVTNPSKTSTDADDYAATDSVVKPL
jgi:hypothetical protein